MKLSIKAALFSALVFPGSGYFIVKSKTKAWLCVISVLCILVIFMLEAVHKAQLIAQKIVSGHISYEISALQEQILLMPGRFDANIITSATWLIIILWLISTVDSYRLGRSIESQ
tara:strand:+ start:5624 stop:5968 length:345 start_codon:yes stop_codon:yes gene_type:complete